MLKFILILFLAFYIIYKLAGFLVRVMVINVAQQQQKQFRRQTEPAKKKARGGNVNIDFIPQDSKNDGKLKGGEYVDYEEVK